VRLRHERGEEVGGLVDEALERYPDNWLLVWTRTRLEIDAGRFDSALPWLENLIRVDIAGLADRGIAYDERLGAMVRREVERHRSRRLRAGRLDDRELVDALERATEPHKELSAIVERLERRLDLAASGASEVDRSNRSWADEIDFGRG
jgi:hypothetical protein